MCDMFVSELHGWGWLLLAILLTPLYFTWRTFAPWVPIKQDDIRRVLRLAALKQGETFADLGCGDGRVVRYVADHSEATVLGVELAYPMYFWSKLRFLLKPSLRAQIRFANLFKVSFADLNVVYVFGMPKTVIGKFQEKCLKELPEGARVISYCFFVEGWEPDAIDHETKTDLPIYLYSIDRLRASSAV